MGLVLYIVQSSNLDKQIDMSGVESVRILASPDISTWLKSFGTRFEGKDADSMKGLLTEEEISQLNWNKERLIRLVKDQNTNILLAQILNRDGKALITTESGKYEEARHIRDPGRASNTYGDVVVSYGNYDLKGKLYPDRIFACPIKDYAGKDVGQAQLILSEDHIIESKANLLLTLMICTVIFMGIGVGVAIFMGRKVAIPVKALIKDVSIVAQGDLDHHTVPKSQDEIGLLARTFDKMTKNLHGAQAREVELAAQRHQVAVAQQVQKKLLPDLIPQIEGYDIQAYFRGSREMHGNYYDVIKSPDGKVGVLVASASGTGIPAAMVMTMARSFMRALVEKCDNLGTMLRECNRLLSPDLRAGMYVELLMVLIDPGIHKGTVISTGPTMLLRYAAEGKKIQAIQADGIAMGLDKGDVFDRTLKESEFEIKPGDRLMLGTQSLADLKDPSGNELSVRGIARFVGKHAAKNSQDFVKGMVNNLDSFAGGEVKEQGITFVTLKRSEA